MDPAEEEHGEFHLWQSANQLVQHVHEFSEDFPRGGDHSLRAGLRRATISVASLLAQAQMKEGAAQQLEVLGKAQVALAEFEVQIDLAGHRDLLSTGQFRALFGELVVLSRELASRCRILRERTAADRRPVARQIEARKARGMVA